MKRVVLSSIGVGAAIILLPRFSHAQTDAHLLLDPWTDGKRFQSLSDVQIFARSDIGRGESTQFTRSINQTRYRFDPSMPLSPSLGVDWTHIELSSSTRLPNQLDDLSLSIGSPLFGKEGDWFGGAAAGIGYAGDDAFAADDAWYGKANAFVGKELAPGRTILFAVDYDGNRSLLPDVPLPSVVYDWKVDDTLEVALGFPVAGVEWKITPKFKIVAEYDFPETIVASAEYQFLPKVAAQLRYLSDDDSFHSEDLPHDRRIFYEDNRIELGLISTLIEGVKLDTGIGWAWDRKFSVGFDDRDSDSVARLDDQFYLRLGAELEF